MVKPPTHVRTHGMLYITRNISRKSALRWIKIEKCW